MAEKKSEPEAVQQPQAPVRVRAKEPMCFYRGMRIRPGKTFTLDDPRDFNPKSMEPVDPAVPDDTATAVAASPKQRGSAGVMLKQKPPGGPPTTPPSDQGI